jgi:hypothetical protein
MRLCQWAWFRQSPPFAQAASFLQGFHPPPCKTAYRFRDSCSSLVTHHKATFPARVVVFVVLRAVRAMQGNSVHNTVRQACFTARDASKEAPMNLWMMMCVGGTVASSTIRKRVEEERRKARNATGPRKHDRNRTTAEARRDAERAKRQDK